MADFLEDPNNLGLLSLGLRLMSTPGKFGTALGQSGMGAIGDMQQAKAAQQTARTRALQEQQMMMQLEELKRAQADRQKQAERQQFDESTMTRLLGMPVENRQSMTDMGPGVPMANRGIDPQTFLKQGGSFGGLGGVLGLNQALAPVAKKPIVSKPGDIARDESGAVMWQNPAEQKDNAFIELMRQAGIDPASPEGRALAKSKLQKEATHQPGTTVSVNTGQKGFDNTLKLRGDFRSEPIYKAHQEVQSAYAQIKASLQQASPAGDLAGATKIMKILDPGSVVRESELGMAMAASGLLDRAQYYATNVLNGTKLTPSQRKDFQALADKLFAESSAQYAAKRSEYQNIATRNGLGVEDVVGPASSNSGWSIKPAP